MARQPPGEPGQSLLAILEAERAERAAKAARLKSLRTQFVLAEADPRVSFAEEIDCTVLVAALRGCSERDPRTQQILAADKTSALYRNSWK
ncbi:hypothetical protein RFM98_26665 [Mesorhizobium sp. VK9D]|uniref:hypothetical protein n=1 Tax=Mesorhizobium australafricanum TaxID=3072311 RepID=UPI002A249E70|nr:hypothetical protein [Mesorhizobium sp. VK9D]MDX8456325.1 hypothetical protein [Mesorhizobium sp. VK9D]